MFHFVHPEGKNLLTRLFLFLLVLNLAIIIWLPDTPYLVIASTLLSLVLFLFVLQFFRFPKREAQNDHPAVLAPVDGVVVAIEEVEETEYFNDRRLMISTFMNVTNVHANWTPIGGVISYVKYHSGKYLAAWHPKSSTENERNTIVIKNDDGTEVLVRQIAGLVARRIKCYVKSGDKVRNGQAYGFIKFGSRVDVFLPTGADINVKLKEKVVATQSILAHL